MKDALYSPAIVCLVIAAGICGFAWIVADYNKKQDAIDAQLQETCIKAGGTPSLGPEWTTTCIFGRGTALAEKKE